MPESRIIQASRSPLASRLASITSPDGRRIVYTYDQQGNLVSARDLITGDTSGYGYDAQGRLTIMTRTGQSGQVIEYPSLITPHTSLIKADLGAALNYLANPYSSTLTAGATDRLVFSVRPSEIASTLSGDVYIGVIVEANAGSSVLPGLPTVAGLTAIASHVTGNSAFALFRVEREGMQLLQIAGANGTTAGAYSVTLFIAGDANRDTKVDGTDSQLIEAALGTTAGAIGYTPLADFDQNGRIESADLHLYRQNLGFIPNQAPTATNATAKTHQDLELLFPVTVSNSSPITHHPSLLSDAEGDPVFYRITGATNGTARIASDGSSVSFTPATGYFGPASFSIVADDGYSTSQVATVTVNVSDAPLVNLDFTIRQPRLDARHSMKLQLVGDFTDEQNVLLPASYLQFESTNPTAASLTLHASRATLHGLSEGTGVITASTAHGPGGVTIQAATAFSVGIPTDQTQQFLYALGLDVFPGAVSLATGGGQRQILADLADTIPLTNGSTGTRYFVSNPNVVTVSADGLITANQAGEAVVTVINGPAESLIPVKVQAPNVGPTLIGTAGGIVQDTNGYQVAIAPDALAASTLVSITPVLQASLPLVMPGPFEYVGSFDLQIGDGRLDIPAQLAIPITGSTLAPGADLVFFRYSTLTNETGSPFGVWMQEETGIFGADSVARTASPPFPGVLKSGTWMIAAAPAGTLARVDGKLNTFFPDQGSSFTVVAPMAGAPIAQEIHSPFFLLIPLGLNPLSFYEFTPVGQVNLTSATVNVLPGQSTNFTTTVINSFVGPRAPFERPEITSARVAFTPTGEAELILTGERFTFDNPSAPANKRIGSSILDAIVNFRVPLQGGTSELADDSDPGYTTLTATPDAATSSSTEIHVRIPDGVIIGLADISVTRRQWEPGPVGSFDQLVPKISDPLRLNVDPHFLFAANNFDSTVSAIDLRGAVGTTAVTRTIHVGDPGVNAAPRSIALSADETRAYVALRSGGGIGVIDTQTLKEVDVNPDNAQFDHAITIPNGHPFWVVADKQGKFLYASDQYTNLIYVVDIDPGSATFHTVVGNIVVNPAAFGLKGMDLSADGKRLYVAAPGDGALVNLTSRGGVNPGKILVVDTEFRQGNNSIWQQIGTIDADQEPYYIKASATDPHLITFANRRSEGAGFGVIQANDSQTAWSRPTYTALTLGSFKDTFDVNDASSIVILPAGTISGQTKDYAFITGWNRIIPDDISRDPFLKERTTIEEAITAGLRFKWDVGGNVGVIEDPFGKFGAPTLIAATQGEFLSMPDGITLSADGTYLFAAFSANNQVEVFDVKKILDTINMHRNDPPFNTLREGPKPILSMNPLDSFDPSIRIGRIPVGRFPQGLAAPRVVPLKLVGPVATGTDLATVNLAQPILEVKGDSTPVLVWTLKDPNGQALTAASTKVYLSVFSAGQGLFPDDLTEVIDGKTVDLASHRIVNGDTNVTVGQNGVYTYQLPDVRALTVGQTYYWGVEVTDAQGNTSRQFSKFDLNVPTPTDLTKFSSVTVITHGFQPEFPNNTQSIADNGRWLFDLAGQIVNGGGSDPDKNILVYSKSTGRWEGNRDSQGRLLLEAGKPLALLTDWWRESDISDSGFSEAAADAFFASLVELNNNSTMPAKIFDSPLHFIGHSRGTVVTSELLQRLGEYENRVLSQQPGYRPLDIQLTMLDVHDELKGPQANLRPFGIDWTDFNEPIVKVWQNVDFAENYYQSLGQKVAIPGFASATPNGREVVGADLNVNLNGLAGFISDDANYESDPSGENLKGPHAFLGPHSRVWRWYAGTTDLNIQSFERTDPGNEPIFRSLQDVARFSPPSAEAFGGGGDLPWYVPLTSSANYYTGHPTLTLAVQNAVWEGIGLGWSYSELGGGKVARPAANLGARIPVANDNTALGETPITPNLTVWNGSAIPSVFNGDFEAGNMQRDALGLYAYYRGASTPGWAFHQLDVVDKTPAKIVPYLLAGSTAQGHAAELSSDGDTELVHNRFYIPSESQFVQFKYFVKEVEYGLNSTENSVPRHPDVNVFVRVGTEEYQIGILSPLLPSSPGGPVNFQSTTPMSLITHQDFNDPTSPSVDLRGKVGELIFRLSFAAGEPPLAPGQTTRARIWIDDVRLGPSGSPLETESVIHEPNGAQGLTAGDLLPLVEASRMGWLGIVEAPDGVTGISSGSFGISTSNLVIMSTTTENRNAGSSEGNFDDQRLFVDFDNVLSSQNEQAVFAGIGFLNAILLTDQPGGDSDPSLTSDGHAVYPGEKTSFVQGEGSSLVDVIVNHDTTDQSEIGKSGSVVDGSTIPVSDIDLSRDLAAPGGNGTITNLQLFDLDVLALQAFPAFSGFEREASGPIEANFLIAFDRATDLAQSQDQQNQSLLQHSLSFGSLTVPPDRDVVNLSAENGQWSMANDQLTAEQLDLLSRATVTIADLADGYLALTLGNTITLDTDAAGYGWFIDQTPLTHEEFVSESSPWQLYAATDGPAAGKIDLMTVLMHELGHVMGLGHVSSAVDGTRLMAGSIDPGIRRLPSALDLGEPSHQHSAISDQPADSHLWDPYVAHYTVAGSGEQTPAPVVNPARLVQAAQLPSHQGVFNSGFGINDPANSQFGWDESGAVTIANGQAVLSENSNVISTLSQLFTLPAGSTHLRFTLVDVNLQTNGANRPSDAFEVAFLEACTLTPLAGVTAGLTQTDSLFNLQQDGTVRFSNRVSLSTGTLSGSTLDLTQPVIVDIDLTGITVGAGARLSFDLLGFGDRTSTIVIDNVLLTDGQPTAAPIAVNDSYTVAEGATLNVPTLGLLTNDSDTDTSAFGLTAFSLAAPAHGTLTLNADGSFSYVHNGSETTTDSFTYRVSDGINFSNLATVSLTITPTNDAPVIAAIPAQSVEQGRTLTVQVVATDPDDSNISPESSALTFSLQPNTLSGVTLDPATGLLSWAVPRTQTVGLYTIAVNVTDAGTPALSATRSFTVDVLELSNTAPTLDPIGPKTVNEESEIRFTIHGSDADVPAQTLVYSATGLPAGATFNATTREFIWTPAEDQGGASYQVTFAVTDGEFAVSELVTITVNEVNVAPVLNVIGPKAVNEESELRFTISWLDGAVIYECYEIVVGWLSLRGLFTHRPAEELCERRIEGGAGLLFDLF